MNSKQLTIEHVLYGVAFLLALVVRLLRLGLAPLSDFEASWALQALDVARANAVSLGPQPGYLIPTGFLFFLLGSSNGLARLIPALTGSLLALLPVILGMPRIGRRGRVAGLVLAFGLALDPVLVTLSRLAGGAMPAIALALLALAAFYSRRAMLAGVCAGLALLFGPSLLTGLLGLALVGGVVVLLQKSGWMEALGEVDFVEDAPEAQPAGRTFEWSRALIGLAASLLVAGTLFMAYPQGLTAWVGTLPAYFNGWRVLGDVPPAQLLVVLLFQQPLVLIFGLIGAIRGWLHSGDAAAYRWSQRLSLWFLIALGLMIFYPARQPGDLAWVVISLWGLTAFELAQHVPAAAYMPAAAEDEKIVLQVALGQAGLIVVLLILMWLNVLALTQAQLQLQFNQISVEYYQNMSRLYLTIILVAIMIAIIASYLIALGWSPRAVRYGLTWGVVVFLGMYVLSGMWGAAHARQNSAQELLSPLPAPGETDLLARTLGDISEWSTGERHEIAIFSTVNYPSLKWALRDFVNARYGFQLAADEYAPVVITALEQTAPQMKDAYRGQDFVLGVTRQGQEFFNWSLWVTLRQAPLMKQQLIVWARNDLFPGGATQGFFLTP